MTMVLFSFQFKCIAKQSFINSSPNISAALLAVAVLIAGLVESPSAQATDSLIAYVGTFSSPLHDVLPTQVDLPPGNGRGIHIFDFDRTTGAMKPIDVFESGTSPSCLAVDSAQTHLYSTNETDR